MFTFRSRDQAPIDPLSSYQAEANSAAAGSWRYGRSGYRRRPAQPIRQPRNWGKIIKRSLLSVAAVLLVAGAYAFFTIGHGKFSLASLLSSTVRNIVLHPTALKGESRGRTNFLVYGMTQDGMRTDSIILVSYYWSQKKLVTLNIPRDLYAYDGYENAKMGEVYAYAKARQPKDNAYPDKYVADVISKEYNVPIDYYAEFNMQGEVDFINAIGGININAPDAFTDYQYPTWDYSGYVRPAPHFNAGPQHMDGSRALIYSRSRHSLNNNEGTDFARSKRQALVIQAVMTKLKSMGIAGNLADISKYLNILGDNVTTNMSTDEMVTFAKTIKNIDPNNDYLKASWASGNGFLCDSMASTGAYVTLYGDDNFCGVGAGGFKDSHSRQIAIYFVQNLLSSAPQSQDDYLTTAKQNLGYIPKPSSNPSSR